MPWWAIVLTFVLIDTAIIGVCWAFAGFKSF